MSVRTSFQGGVSAAQCATPLLRSKRWQSAAAVFRGLCCKHSSIDAICPQARVHRQSSGRQVAARAWGAEVEWKDATIEHTEGAALGLQRLIVDVGEEIAKGYQSGGQFLQMKVGDSKAAFLAIASPPDPKNEGAMEFLIRAVPNSTAELLCNLKQGDKALVSPVMGKGFQVGKIPVESFDTVLMFATGSGISPIKALIESGALDIPARKDVRLYYGANSEEAMAYTDRVAEWEAMGVKVIKVLSSNQEGYVQDVFAKDTPVADGSRTCVILCGQKEMCEAVKAIVAEQGVAVENCLLNF